MLLIPLLLAACAGAGDDTGNDDTGRSDGAPSAPALTATDPASPSNDATPEVIGRAEAGATVGLFSDGACSTSAGQGTADGEGDFRIEVTVAVNTTTTLSANATNAEGTSPCSASRTYVHDGQAPEPPVITSIEPTSPSDDETPQVLGTAEAGALVTFYSDPGCTLELQSLAANAQGQFAMFIGVPEDTTTTLYGTVTDDAGNVSACTLSGTYIEDSSAPEPPTWTGTDPASPANDNAPTLSGTTEAGATVKVYGDEACAAILGTVTADGTGAFSFDATAADSAVAEFYATATDAVGYTSGCSPALTYIEDSSPPDVPHLTHTSPASPSPYNTPYFYGWTEPSATVTLYTSNTCDSGEVSPPVDASGNFTLQPTLSDGETVAYWGIAIDQAGNSSACGGGLSYTDSGPATELLLLGVAPFGDPKRVDTAGSLDLQALWTSTDGDTVDFSWIVVDGGGTLTDGDTAAPTFNAPAEPGVVWLRVTATGDSSSDSLDFFVQVESDGWFIVQERMSADWADFLELELSPTGSPWVMNLDGSAGGFDLFDVNGDHVETEFPNGEPDGLPLAYLDSFSYNNAAAFEIDDQGDLWVAFADDDQAIDPHNYVYVARLTSVGWQIYGDLTGFGASGSVDLDLSTGTPWVALETSDADIAVLKWEGEDWVAVGDTFEDTDNNQGIGHMSLAVRGDTAVVGYRYGSTLANSGAAVFGYDSTAGWTELGDLDSSVRQFSDVVISSNGTLFASYAEGAGGTPQAAVVKRYLPLPDRWEAVGVMDGSGTLAFNDHVHMTIDRDDHLYIQVKNNIQVTENWEDWSVIGGAPFGEMFVGHEFSDMRVRQEGGDKIVYVAFPNCVMAADNTCSNTNLNLTSIAAYVLD